MILSTPVLAESHIRKKSRLDMIVVIVYELLICVTVKVEIQFFLIVIGELIIQQLVHKFLVVFSHFFGDWLSIIPP